jgi:hypothetical protein
MRDSELGCTEAAGPRVKFGRNPGLREPGVVVEALIAEQF